MAGGCGPCTLCCTVMKVQLVQGEPPKPEREPCKHCTKAGCGIYEDRPVPCRVFSCLWLASQDRAEAAMPRELRPDRTGCVLETNHSGNLIVHCKRPGAWKRQPLLHWLESMATRLPVIIETGKGAVLIMDHHGRTHPMEFVDIDPDTNEERYRIDWDAIGPP